MSRTSARSLLLATVASLTLATNSTAWGGAAGDPPVGATAAEVDLRALEATPYQEGLAIPLRAETPSWYTAELHRQVLAAGGASVAAPAQAPLPSEVGIRPGAWMTSPAGCTMNFIFQSGSSYAIGTAGHCVDGVGQPVTLLTIAPGGSNPVLVNVGNVTRRDNGIGDDFALVSVDPVLNQWVDPTIAVIAGPAGATSDPARRRWPTTVTVW